jgi:hypothetical protein
VPGGAADDGAISDEARLLAARALRRAAEAETPARIRRLTDQALSEERDDMTPAQIRALAADALAQAQKISALMTRLADLLDADTGGRG